MPYPNAVPLVGFNFETELAIAQFVIAAGGGATFSNANSATLSAGGICTFTTNAAHGLTMTPATGVPPNYFVTFGASSSAITGTGVLINNIFRILTIPSTTTFTFWSTISSATVTSTTVIPVFFPPFIAGPIVPGYGPTQTISSVVTNEGAPLTGLAHFNFDGGANCEVQYNPDNKAIGLDQSTGNTPGTAPTWRVLIAASGAGLVEGAYPNVAVWATGTTATSYVSVLN
jgi:hypothetical protein